MKDWLDPACGWRVVRESDGLVLGYFDTEGEAQRYVSDLDLQLDCTIEERAPTTAEAAPGQDLANSSETTQEVTNGSPS